MRRGKDSPYNCNLRLWGALVLMLIFMLLTILTAVLKPVLNGPEHLPDLPFAIQETQPVGTHPSHLYQQKIKEMLQSSISEEDEVFPEESMDDEQRRLPSSDYNSDGQNGDTTSEKPAVLKPVFNGSETGNPRQETQPVGTHPSHLYQQKIKEMNQELKQKESEDQQFSFEPRRRRTLSESSNVPDDVGDSAPMSPPRDHPNASTDDSHHSSTVAYSHDDEEEKPSEDTLSKKKCKSSGEEDKK